MPHLDEGHIHAMLDGELTPADREAAEQHLRACAECQQLLAEARSLFAEADRLVETLVPPPAGKPVRQAAPIRPRRENYQWLAWAATVVIAVGLGYYGSAFRDRPKAALSDDSALKQEALRERASGNIGATPPADAASGNEQKSETRPAPELAKSAAAARAADSVATTSETAPGTLTLRGQRSDALERSVDEGQMLRDKEGNEKDAKAQAEPPGRLAEVPMPKPKVLNTEIPTGFRASSLEEAVRVLGGSVLLIDGMTPQMVLVGPGAAFAGGNPDKELVRVVYEDPPGRQLWLDQQRIEQGPEGAAQALRATSKLNLLPGDTLITPATDGASSLNWVSQTMFRLGLRGFLPADSLRVLARRVR